MNRQSGRLCFVGKAVGLWILAITDIASKRIVYIQRPLDVLLSHGGHSGAGIAASPAVAGKYLYVMGNQGVTLVLEPGHTYKQVARNEIHQIHGWNHAEESTQGTLVFEGSRIYCRGAVNLYCIGKK